MLTLRPIKNTKTNGAFTLVEILVVIAITAVLFTLLLGPLVNSFRLTQSAQMQVAAQDAARRTSEIISRELGTAAYVFSNTTHPFEVLHPSGPASGIPDARYSNFLVLNVPEQSNGSLVKGGTVAVAFNAKLDFVLPRHNSVGQLVDPTTQEPITIKNGAAAPTGFTFPLAPGTSMIRYFIGLRQPFTAGANNTYTANLYAPQGEGALLAGNVNNTYVLYRAQFTPYTTTTTNGTTTSSVNSALFATNSAGAPEFDDPDFFRIVAQGDPNWLDASHKGYTATQAADHNKRVANWFQIAKPVISSPNIDLILLPHNTDNTLAYDPANDTTPGSFPGVAHSGAVHDPVTGTDWPVVNTSVTFQFASVSADATASTTTNDESQGVGANVAAADSGLPYVPTVYTATDQSWANPYHISLYQYDAGYAAYNTNLATTTTSDMAAGDLIEAMYTSPSDASGTPVYDITSGVPLVSSGEYVPMTVSPDTATINFDMPSLPIIGNPYQRYFQATVGSVAATNGYLDLSAISNTAGATATTNLTSPLPNVPLDPSQTPATMTAYQVANARLVPGSVRVYGPDAEPGPDNGQQVLYTEVFAGNTAGPQANQYEVDYAHNALRMNLADLANSQSQVISVAFDYQANLAPAYNAQSANPVIAPGNPAYPLEVKVDYQTRDLVDVNLGVRVYDPNNVGPAQVVTVHNQVRIGNSNR